jgi:hypothetical protein
MGVKLNLSNFFGFTRAFDGSENSDPGEHEGLNIAKWKQLFPLIVYSNQRVWFEECCGSWSSSKATSLPNTNRREV